MNLRFWRPVARRRVGKPLLMITGGFLSLALIVGALIAGALFTRPASAASKQPQAALTGPAQRLEVVTTDNGQVEHQWSDDNGTTWSGLVSLGQPDGNTPLVGTPAAVSDGNGRLNVFAQGQHQGSLSTAIYQKIDNNGQWSGWTQVPGQDQDLFGSVGIGCDIFTPDCGYLILSAPAVASWGPGRMDLFVYAMDDHNRLTVIHTWMDDNNWSGTWEDLGPGQEVQTMPAFLPPPTAVSWGGGRIDVFGRGMGNELEHTWFDGHWSGWENLGGTITSSPSVASPGAGRLNVFARGAEGHLWSIGYVVDTGWSNWSDVGDGCCLAGDVKSSVAVVAPALNILDVFVISTNPNHALYSRAGNLTSGWAGWQLITSPTTYTNIGAATWFPGTPPPPPPTPTHTPEPTPTRPICHQPPCTSTP